MPFHVDDSDAATARVTFELPADQHDSIVSVVGSFNNWTPGAHELRSDGAGMISATAEVPYGRDVYFRYLSADDGWFDDPEAEPAGDGSRIEPIAYPLNSPDAADEGPATIDLSGQATPAAGSKSSRR